MKKTGAAVVLAFTLWAGEAGEARAEEPPPTGTALIVVGSLLGAAGVGNLATAPLCYSSSIRASLHTQCVGVSLAFGGAFLAASIPLVVVGAHRRSVWLDWTRRGGVTVTPSGAAMTWTSNF